MALLGKKIAISLPDTLLEDKESLREKTAKLGIIARACAIYGVDVIEVFKDPRGKGEEKVVHKVLEYLETPQYLRKRLFPLDEELRYAGMLPPLRIPSHKPRIPADRLEAGEVREGVVNADGTVDIGLDVAPKLRQKSLPGRRVTARVVSLRPPMADLLPRERAGPYWGYSVEAKTTAEVLSDPRFGLKIATSRLGTPVLDELGRLKSSLQNAEGVKLIFGSPSGGLLDIVGRDLPRRVDYVVNFFPEQQVETVRTEEAVLVSLGVVSLLSAQKA
ncbi:MAG TPA: RNA methyltransferase [Nitrososphaerales archaeon]|nr:RNA methyltransferase [Nitrososphaerales archaeon]